MFTVPVSPERNFKPDALFTCYLIQILTFSTSTIIHIVPESQQIIFQKNLIQLS